ncbi:MAG: hypothetical protein C5B48_05930 [Candidatus Rokuibacteriota bacterium]|nr:MAG: hypothetical protein C5B48_05930 [Candidatus Rokubacteria bacterium]
MWRTASTVGILVLAVLLGGCGGGGTPQARRSPHIPRALARDLAGRSDQVALTLERGDACAARGQIASLAQATRQAVVSGRVPSVFRRRLVSAVEAITAEAPACVRLSEGGDQGDAARDKRRGGHHGHGKHKGQDGGGD